MPRFSCVLAWLLVAGACLPAQSRQSSSSADKALPLEKLQLPPQVPATASRVAVPVYREGKQVGKATSSTWSPVLKKMVALATVERRSAQVGSRVEMEVTVEAVRHRVGATVTPTPFFNPARKTAGLA